MRTRTGKRGTGTARLLVLAVTLAALATDAQAGALSPGEYRGVVVFDRWDACTLYNGVYLMYVSERVKEELRPHEGEAVRVDATRVFQPLNPGDGLIEEFRYLGPMPPADPRFAGRDGEWLADGLALRATVKEDTAGRAVVAATVRNEGREPRTVHRGDLAPTLLVKLSERYMFCPSDGPSVAALTRVSLTAGWLGEDEPLREYPGPGAGVRNGFTVEPALPKTFVLRPGEEQVIEFDFDLPRASTTSCWATGAAGTRARRSRATRSRSTSAATDGSGRWKSAAGRRSTRPRPLPSKPPGPPRPRSPETLAAFA